MHGHLLLLDLRFQIYIDTDNFGVENFVKKSSPIYKIL